MLLALIRQETTQDWWQVAAWPPERPPDYRWLRRSLDGETDPRSRRPGEPFHDLDNDDNRHPARVSEPFYKELAGLMLESIPTASSQKIARLRSTHTRRELDS
jgi:hypothetical protein